MSVCPACDQPTADPAAAFCAHCGFALPAPTAAYWTEPESVAGPESIADPVFAADADFLAHDSGSPPRPQGARAIPVALAALAGAVILAIALSYGSGSGPPRHPRSAVSAAQRSPRSIGPPIAALGSKIAFTGPRVASTSGALAIVSLPTAGSADAVPTTRYRTGSYSFAYPSSWSVAKDNQPVGSYRETVLQSPDQAAKVTVDYSPGETTPPAAKAAQVESATSLTPGYQQSAFRATKVGARPAFEWLFKVAAPHPRRADLFVNTGRAGFALLAYGADFARARSAGRAIAASLTQSR